jgi:hypothetical protein
MDMMDTGWVIELKLPAQRLEDPETPSEVQTSSGTIDYSPDGRKVMGFVDSKGAHPEKADDATSYEGQRGMAKRTEDRCTADERCSRSVA